MSAMLSILVNVPRTGNGLPSIHSLVESIRILNVAQEDRTINVNNIKGRYFAIFFIRNPLSGYVQISDATCICDTVSMVCGELLTILYLPFFMKFKFLSHKGTLWFMSDWLEDPRNKHKILDSTISLDELR